MHCSYCFNFMNIIFHVFLFQLFFQVAPCLHCFAEIIAHLTVKAIWHMTFLSFRKWYNLFCLSLAIYEKCFTDPSVEFIFRQIIFCLIIDMLQERAHWSHDRVLAWRACCHYQNRIICNCEVSDSLTVSDYNEQEVPHYKC